MNLIQETEKQKKEKAPRTFAANLAVVLLPVLYGVTGAAVLIPVKGRLKKQLDL